MFVSPLLLEMLAALALLVAAVQLWRQRRFQRARDRLVATLDAFSEGEFQPLSVRSEAAALKPLAQACDRLLPQVHSAMTQLELAARRDPMTDLLNSSAFRQTVQSALAAAPAQGAMLVVGINGLKKVNDSLGRAGGDQLVCAVADRMRLAAHYDSAEDVVESDERSEPLVGRLGGDEFAIFLPADLSREAGERFIQKLRRVIGETLHIGPQSLRVKVSIGVALASSVGGQYDKLLAAADAAMARSRSEGPGGYRFYSPAMRREADEMLEKEIDLRLALERGEFCLYFQPQVNLLGNSIDSVEALIRWNHPTRGLVMPGDFIPFAESYGLIDDIGEWVMLEAVRTAARWHREGHPLRMSINVSPQQLYRIELIPMIRACLARFNLPPRYLEIEITEAAIMRKEAFSLERIEGLRRDGVSVALDDFGTGYSNLAQLMSMPMDRLKLDRSLLTDITTDRRQQVVASAIIGMASELGFEIVAEGVEEQAQADLLRLAGCDTIQGYLVAPPLPEPELMAMLARMRENPERRLA